MLSLVFAAILSLVAFTSSFSRRRSLAFGICAGTLILVYNFDAIATYLVGFLYFSKGLGTAELSLNTAAIVAWQSTALVVALSIQNFFIGRDLRLARLSAIRPRALLLVSGTCITLGLALVLASARGIALAEFVSNRQHFLQGNLLLSILVYSIPGIAMLALIAQKNSQTRLQKNTATLILIISIILGILSGSRTTFLLTTILPCILYASLDTAARKNKSVINSTNILVAFSILAASFFLATQYRDLTRGAQDDVNVFVSSDFISFDSTAYLIDRVETTSDTYSAAFTFLIPRSVWTEKPYSGNHVVTSTYFPLRFEGLGRAEVTASILGEAHLNYRFYGLFVPFILLSVLLYLCDRLLSQNSIFCALGIIISFRVANLIRGDLLNFIAPAFFIFIIFLIAHQLHGLFRIKNL